MSQKNPQQDNEEERQKRIRATLAGTTYVTADPATLARLNQAIHTRPFMFAAMVLMILALGVLWLPMPPAVDLPGRYIMIPLAVLLPGVFSRLNKPLPWMFMALGVFALGAVGQVLFAVPLAGLTWIGLVLSTLPFLKWKS